MKVIQQCTKDCPRDDCRVSHGGAASTLISHFPTYDKSGNPANQYDPNIVTESLWCNTCGKAWTAKTQGGTTTISETTR